VYKTTAEERVDYSPIWQNMMYGNIWLWSAFHTALGLLSLLSPVFIIFWLYLLIITFISGNVRRQLNTLPGLIGYIIPVEVIGRMTEATPFIPHEAGKYFGILFLIYGIYLLKVAPKGSVGKWILFLSLPAAIIGYGNSVTNYMHIVANYAGIFTLSLSIIFFANLTLTRMEIMRIFKLIFFPSFSILTYVFVRSPDIEASTVELASNARFSGGFGANQVSTILGMAFGITLFFWLIRYKLFPKNWLNLAVPFLFLVWALLSFSRGGVITGVASILFIILMVSGTNRKLAPRKINLPVLTAIMLVIGGGFWYINTLTNNKLLLRFQGETPGTLAGVKERDLSHLTTGRWDILKSDLAIWSDHLLFGVGVGMSQEVRPEYGIPFHVAAHTEVSRLISEHGLLGIVISIIFLTAPIYLYLKNKRKPFHQAFIILCMSMAVITSFHSAMRTLLTPFFYGIAFSYIPNERGMLLKSIKNKKNVI
jgi:O-antigen ligase